MTDAKSLVVGSNRLRVRLDWEQRDAGEQSATLISRTHQTVSAAFSRVAQCVLTLRFTSAGVSRHG